MFRSSSEQKSRVAKSKQLTIVRGCARPLKIWSRESRVLRGKKDETRDESRDLCTVCTVVQKLLEILLLKDHNNEKMLLGIFPNVFHEFLRVYKKKSPKIH